MKISVLLAFILGTALSLQAAPPFVTPSYVKELEDLEKVKKTAAENNKGITFFLMEPGST